MVTKVDNYGLQNMDRDILGACGHDAGGVELQDPIACPAESQQLDTVWMNLPGDIPHLVSVPCPCASRPRPPSERLFMTIKP